MKKPLEPESPERSDEALSQPRPVKKATPTELEPQSHDADPLFDSTDASQLNLWAGEIKAEANENH